MRLFLMPSLCKQSALFVADELHHLVRDAIMELLRNVELHLVVDFAQLLPVRLGDFSANHDRRADEASAFKNVPGLAEIVNRGRAQNDRSSSR